ncbi:lysoplasmalogenase family protein [Xanthomarina sp. F1114]|uniref:lysoplasmalogenase family protein n=1 Tax=Xanthomarina sp. F1114 TaxID=2996019 RepID=UPI00225E03BB|nr:lysoplasmalogenase family protein [Xanthomarina sp. F1114]MCX7549131.1 lysoplasmalogenase family protein [Xanthomarina sp. F1114]
MRLNFKNTRQFTLLYFFLLTLDIVVKLTCPIAFRFATKPLLVLALLLFYFQHRESQTNKDQLWVFLALGSFLIGDILIINHINPIFLSASIVAFTLGKIFFSIKFIHKEDFNVARLIPFSMLLFAYIFGLVTLVYEGLESYFAIAIISFFFTLVILQFAFLRKSVFSLKSYYYVFIGVLFYLISESIMAIKTFKQDLPFQEFFIMLTYGAAIYFIIMGIVFEKEGVEVRAQ